MKANASIRFQKIMLLAKNFLVCYYLYVSYKEIKSGVAELPEEQQDQLAAFLVHLRHQRDAASRHEISSLLNDKDPGHWASVDQLRKRWKD